MLIQTDAVDFLLSERTLMLEGERCLFSEVPNNLETLP